MSNQAVTQNNNNNKDPSGRFYGTGGRKNSVARVWIKFGSGNFTVNKRDINSYFSTELLKNVALSPFIATSSLGKFDVYCTVKGGGLSGQAQAIKHGISKALDLSSPQHHKILRKEGFLTRDSRRVERKKYGKLKARKSTQYSKR